MFLFPRGNCEVYISGRAFVCNAEYELGKGMLLKEGQTVPTVPVRGDQYIIHNSIQESKERC